MLRLSVSRGPGFDSEHTNSSCDVYRGLPIPLYFCCFNHLKPKRDRERMKEERGEGRLVKETTLYGGTEKLSCVEDSKAVPARPSGRRMFERG
jgi:hypothetical protein